MKNNMTLTVGAIRGRHELPVSKYVMDGAIPDVTDTASIQLAVASRLDQLISETGRPIVQIKLYVTGLTVVSMAVVNYCQRRGLALLCYHYDNKASAYYPQRVLRANPDATTRKNVREYAYAQKCVRKASAGKADACELAFAIHYCNR